METSKRRDCDINLSKSLNSTIIDGMETSKRRDCDFKFHFYLS